VQAIQAAVLFLAAYRRRDEGLVGMNSIVMPGHDRVVGDPNPYGISAGVKAALVGEQIGVV